MSNSRVPSGTVGVISMDTGRYAEFALSMGRLDLPRSWTVMGAMNYDEAHARNFLADQAEGEYLWFIDDDHAFNPTILRELLKHDVEVVAPLVLQRKAPFLPVAIKDGHHIKPSAKLGLYEVDLMGTAGMLIRRSVFDKLERPYFWHNDLPDGTHQPSDTNFCRSLREAGVKLHVDTGQSMAHFNALAIYPRLEDGKWIVGGAVANQEVVKWSL